MARVLVTGSAGLIGSEAVRFFAEKGFAIIGIDNDLRASFFGPEASTKWDRDLLKEKYGRQYRHYDVDIRNRETMENVFREYSSDLDLIIHPPTLERVFRAAKQDLIPKANSAIHLRVYLVARKQLMFIQPTPNTSAL